MVNFPSSIDDFTNPTGTDKLNSPDHATQHINANDAIEALEAKVGANSSAVTTSHDYKLSGVTGSSKAVSTGDNLSVLSATTSAQLAGIISDETGSGSLVFATSPVLTTPNLGTPSAATLTNGTGLPLTTGVTGTLAVANGGTGATTAAGARTNLGAGDVAGPASATDNAVTRYDGTTGKLVQNSGVTIDDSNNVYIEDGTLTVADNVGGSLTMTNTGDITASGAVLSLVSASGILMSGSTAHVGIVGSASGPAQLQLYEDSDNGTNYAAIVAPASMAANRAITLPDATDTLVGKATTDTLTNKTLTDPTITRQIINGSTQPSDPAGMTSYTTATLRVSDGTNYHTLANIDSAQTFTNKTLTSPTLTTPDLGTPSALVLTNATAVPYAGLSTGMVVQVVSTSTSAVATGTTTIPLDDTAPQNTEGTEFMTLAITPKNASNTLIVEVIFEGDNSAASYHMIVGLFQDTTASALAATTTFVGTTVRAVTIPLAHSMAAGTTSATTFKVRAGCDVAGTTTFNGRSSGRLFGAITKSSMKITEIKA